VRALLPRGFTFNDATRNLLNFKEIPTEHHTPIEHRLTHHVNAMHNAGMPGGNKARFEAGVGKYLAGFADHMPNGTSRGPAPTPLHISLDYAISKIDKSKFDLAKWQKTIQKGVTGSMAGADVATHTGNYQLWPLFVEMLNLGWNPAALRA